MPDKCDSCGGPVKGGICAYCGKTYETPAAAPVQTQYVQQPPVYYNQAPQTVYVEQVPAYSNKSKTTAALLCFFLGWLGAHRFYTGKIGTAILYLFTAGLWGVGALVDFIMILVGSYRDTNGLILK